MATKTKKAAEEMDDEQAFKATVAEVVETLKHGLETSKATAAAVFDTPDPTPSMVAFCQEKLDFTDEDGEEDLLEESQNQLAMAAEISRQVYGIVSPETMSAAYERLQIYIENGE